MSWRPPGADPDDLDPRLAPFRDRGGRLLRDDGTVAAELYLQSQVWWQGRGWLWWKRWSEPVETVDAFVLDAHGHITAEYFVFGEGLDEELLQWSASTFEHEDENFGWSGSMTKSHERCAIELGSSPPRSEEPHAPRTQECARPGAVPPGNRPATDTSLSLAIVFDADLGRRTPQPGLPGRGSTGGRTLAST